MKEGFSTFSRFYFRFQLTICICYKFYHIQMRANKSKGNISKRQEKLIQETGLQSRTFNQSTGFKNKKKTKNSKNIKEDKDQPTKVRDKVAHLSTEKLIKPKPIGNEYNIGKNEKVGKNKESWEQLCKRFKKILDEKTSFTKQETCPTTDRQLFKKEKPGFSEEQINTFYKSSKVKQVSANNTHIHKNKGFSELLSDIQSKLNQYPIQAKSKEKKSNTKSKNKQKYGGDKSLDKNKLNKSKQQSGIFSKLSKTKLHTLSVKTLPKNKIKSIEERIGGKAKKSVEVSSRKKRVLTHENVEKPEKFENLELKKWEISQEQDSSVTSGSQQNGSSIIVHQSREKLEQINFLEQLKICKNAKINENHKTPAQWADEDPGVDLNLESAQKAQRQSKEAIISQQKQMKPEDPRVIIATFEKKDDKTQKLTNKQKRRGSDVSESSEVTSRQIQLSEMFRREEDRWLSLKKNLQVLRKNENFKMEDLDKIIEYAQSNHLALKQMEIKPNGSIKNEFEFNKEEVSNKSLDFQVQVMNETPNEKVSAIQKKEQNNKNINININISSQGIKISSPLRRLEQASHSETISNMTNKNRISQQQFKLVDNSQPQINKDSQPIKSTENEGQRKKKLNYEEAPLQITKIMKKKSQQYSKEDEKKSKKQNEKRLLEDISLLQFMSEHSHITDQQKSSENLKRNIYEEINRHKQMSSPMKQKKRRKPHLKISLFSRSDEKSESQEQNSRDIRNKINLVDMPEQINSFHQKNPINFIKKYDINQKPQKDNYSEGKLNISKHELSLTDSQLRNQSHKESRQAQPCKLSLPEKEQQLKKNDENFQRSLVIKQQRNHKSESDSFLISSSLQNDTFRFMTKEEQQKKSLENGQYLEKFGVQELKSNLFISQAKEFESEQQLEELIALKKCQQVEIYSEEQLSKRGVITEQKDLNQQIIEKSHKVYSELLPWLNENKNEEFHMNSPNQESNQYTFQFYLNKKQQEDEEGGNVFQLSKPKYSADTLIETESYVVEDLVDEAILQIFQLIRYKTSENCCIRQKMNQRSSSEAQNQLQRFIERNRQWNEENDNIQIFNYSQPQIQKDAQYIREFGLRFLNFFVKNFGDQIFRNVCKPLGIKSPKLLKLIREMNYESFPEAQRFFPFDCVPQQESDEQIEAYQSVIDLQYFGYFQESLKTSDSEYSSYSFQQFFNQSIFDYVCNTLDELRPYGKRGLPPLNFFKQEQHAYNKEDKLKQIENKLKNELDRVSEISLGIIDMNCEHQIEAKRSVSRFLASAVRQIEEDWLSQREGEFQFIYEVVNEMEVIILWNQILELQNVFHRRAQILND